MSKQDRTRDSIANMQPGASTPSDSTLRGIYEALKSQGAETQRIDLESRNILQFIPPLQLVFLAILAAIVCATQWAVLTGSSGRFLPALIPVFLGCVLPTVAFYIALLSHNHVVGQDIHLDAALVHAARMLPILTVLTLPGFLVLAVFLMLVRKRLTLRSLWLASLVGTGIMTAILLGTHPGMYDLLFSRERMHSTTGIGIMFVSVYCVIAAALTSILAWQREKHRLRSSQQSDPG
jgi:hypothetical protein